MGGVVRKSVDRVAAKSGPGKGSQKVHAGKYSIFAVGVFLDGQEGEVGCIGVLGS